MTNRCDKLRNQLMGNKSTMVGGADQGNSSIFDLPPAAKILTRNPVAGAGGTGISS